jgi:hypothetical protein
VNLIVRMCRRVRRLDKLDCNSEDANMRRLHHRIFPALTVPSTYVCGSHVQGCRSERKDSTILHNVDIRFVQEISCTTGMLMATFLTDISAPKRNAEARMNSASLFSSFLAGLDFGTARNPLPMIVLRNSKVSSSNVQVYVPVRDGVVELSHPAIVAELHALDWWPFFMETYVWIQRQTEWPELSELLTRSVCVLAHLNSVSKIM